MHMPESDPQPVNPLVASGRVMPADRDGATIRTILLATDLSPASAIAEDLAFELATRLDGTLLLVSVIDPQRLWLPSGGYRERIDQARETRQIAAHGIVERGRKGGMAVRTLIWEGDPGEAIVEAAIAENVDLVVVGSHQRRGVDRLVMGSVSEQVVRTSPVPVMVARRRPR
jgi:nucleotide-binding universal stress UspA family protein